MSKRDSDKPKQLLPQWQSAFARIRTCLRSEPGQIPAALQQAADIPPTLQQLTKALALSPFEQDIITLCLGMELDTEMAAACGGDRGAHPPHPSVALALSQLPGAHWSALAPDAPLRHWQLLQIDKHDALIAARLRLDERLLHHLLGLAPLDTRLAPYLNRIATAAWLPASMQRQAAQLAAKFGEPLAPVLQLEAGDINDAMALAAAVCQSQRLSLWHISAENLPDSRAERDTFALLWQREARLARRALLISCGEGETARRGAGELAQAAPWVFVAGGERLPALRRPLQRCGVGKPAAAEQFQAWQQLLGAEARKLNGELAQVSSQFSLGLSSLTRAAGEAQQQLRRGQTPRRALWNVCRDAARPRLTALAQEIEAVADWEDLVLPPREQQVMHTICAQVRHQHSVYQQGGFAGKSRRGLGISALFFGESGTGKTLAAEVLAKALDLALFRIDLSAVVNKYIGETEKNLRAVFDAAEEGGAILLFDEADALFGKRSDVCDSHDRYANIEVSYLLQRMENYRGLAILTSNLKSALDRAFVRRIRFMVEFPFPDRRQRQQIWQRVFPAATATAELDFQRLAQLNIAGGAIRNIALNAAFLAAEDARPVAMQHIHRAAQVEYTKLEKQLTAAETGGWL